MAVRWYQVAVQARDLLSLARFWCQVLDWRVVFESEEEVVIASAPDALPGICFVPVSERKTAQNRLRIDLTPDDQAAEASEARWGPPAEGWGRLLALGARRADVGQGEGVTWTVLADPEGNEFCVLRPKKTLLD